MTFNHKFNFPATTVKQYRHLIQPNNHFPKSRLRFHQSQPK